MPLPLSVQILIPLLGFALSAGAAFVVIGLFERRRDPRLPNFAPVVLVAASVVAVMILSRLVFSSGEQNDGTRYLLSLFFLVPFLLLRFYYRQSWYRSGLYGALILALVPTVNVFFALFINGLSRV